MSDLIDLKSHRISAALNLLLKDRTTKRNIIFATEAYAGIDFTMPITKKLLADNTVDIRPRVAKSMEEQAVRTRKKAEVFTPSWICNKMNNHCDTEWFCRENVFNVEQDHEWIPTEEKIEFPDGKSWKDYVDSRRLEITCGEAPYLVSRYDAATGEIIPLHNRIGILDRKLRIVNENTRTHKTWNQWAYRAFESVYGYEYQGDNLLIARINLLETFCEYTQERWHKEPKDSALKRIAKIISWNLWQMDGIKGIIPHKGIAKEPAEENEQYQLTLFESMGVAESEPKSNEILQETIDCKIYDWRENKSVIYKSMKEG
ncbi:MAG: restriction endonuclease subunit M [Selenomonadales bacterium]|nr:restriction endonuclease subunit M [Selenomonadales bacterium]